MISLADQSQPRGYPLLSVRIRKSYKNREVHVGVRRCPSVSVQLSEGFGCAPMGVPPRGRVLPRRGYVSVSVQMDNYKSSITFSLSHALSLSTFPFFLITLSLC